ncbi:hypothetical protein LV89_01880 [Arcicella aurantiaca]|uniref:Uncharacterized protein n=1 Tax=Arcicella aurantiaca TaxID=591202 RepID=A0A316EUZ6_9BACT|nr:hypothetical protein LV89_01880 [Arcicella aurantiaca]
MSINVTQTLVCKFCNFTYRLKSVLLLLNFTRGKWKTNKPIFALTDEY